MGKTRLELKVSKGLSVSSIHIIGLLLHKATAGIQLFSGVCMIKLAECYSEYIITALLMLTVSTVNGDSVSKSVCPLWHVEQMERCQCINTLGGLIKCSEGTLSVVKYIICLIWNKKTDSVCAGYCLLSQWITKPAKGAL